MEKRGLLCDVASPPAACSTSADAAGHQQRRADAAVDVEVETLGVDEVGVLLNDVITSPA